MALLDVIGKATPAPTDKLAATVARLAMQAEAAQAEADALRLKHESMLVQRALDDESLEDAQVNISKREADAARDKADALAAALATAKAQQSAQASEKIKADTAARIARGVAKLEQLYGAEFAVMADLIQKHAQQYNHILKLREEAMADIGSLPISEATVTERAWIETAMRFEMNRAGLAWVPPGAPRGVAIVPMEDKGHEAMLMMRNWTRM